MKLAQLFRQPALWLAVFAVAIVAAIIHMPVPDASAAALTLGDLGPLAGLGLLGVTVDANVLRNLFTGFKAAFKKGFDGVAPQWDQIATRVPSTTSQEDYAWLGDMPAIREWVGDRVVRGLAESGYTIKNKSYELTVGVKRDKIEDDQYGIYTPLMQDMGQRVRQFPDKLVFGLLKDGFTTLCYDGQYFFDNDHPVGQGVVSNVQAGAGNPWFLLDTRHSLKPLIYQERKPFEFIPMVKPDDEMVFTRAEYRYGTDGRCNVGYGFWQMAFASKAALDATNFNAGYAAMGAFKDEAGEPLGVLPNLLVCGPSNREAALTVVKAERNANGATNINRDVVDVLVVPWLA
ncbi:Mu-like prophage FluMu major head subunit [Methyloversatilis universalis FAM5]|uniref:Mu-like prophage FluMu major head subunit n=1 Tax=Methyloversatilis universalis (strain ATCC BAA-1314 / DSM 25237 / JCM 13912 / CCUG 52030 / FAM5) TaxID=1000565 RepID=F5RBW3_METUF|nr:Mu-like prophage major head subunit gpT family protein [Methyloversatilis universalis]EGK71980.1 Mu-like prophage FluMu major head subunit [Methyloversatilis universalis FAM5]